MSCSNTLIPMGFQLVASASNAADVFYPATGWMSSTAIKSVRTSFEMRGRNGNVVVKTAYQCANDPNSPDTATALTYPGGQTSDGVYYGTFEDISSNTSSKQWVRFGFVTKNQTDSTLSTAQVSGRVETKS